MPVFFLKGKHKLSQQVLIPSLSHFSRSYIGRVHRRRPFISWRDCSLTVCTTSPWHSVQRRVAFPARRARGGPYQQVKHKRYAHKHTWIQRSRNKRTRGFTTVISLVKNRFNDWWSPNAVHTVYRSFQTDTKCVEYWIVNVCVVFSSTTPTQTSDITHTRIQKHWALERRQHWSL